MGLETSVNLITATLDLQLVRLLREAMSPAGASPAGVIGPAPSPEPRPRIDPEPLIEPRQRITPTPHFEPRFVIRPEPRVEQAQCVPCCPEATCAPAEPLAKSPIEPPWRVLPWEMPAQPAPRVKVVIHRPDIIHKGSLIDLFI